MKFSQLIKGFLIMFMLAACSVEGGTPLDPTPKVVPTTAPTATVEAGPQSWILGMTEEPLDLYPYSVAIRSSAALVELLYPAPLTVINDTYTTTGVLERVPSFENGDVAYVNTTVYLDKTGAITQTQTDVITTVRQLTITYRWNKNLRWSDGTPLTAEDSVFAYKILRGSASTPQLALQSDLTFDYVTLDQYTTKAYLAPLRDDPNYLMTVWTPLPRHLFAENATAQEVAARLERQPLGYGLYTLEAWNRGAQIDFIRSSTALDPNVPERLGVRLYPNLAELRDDVVSGRVDVGWSDELPDNLMSEMQASVQAQALAVWLTATPIWEHIDMNLSVASLQDIRVRHAIAHGFNRAALAKRLYGDEKIVWDSWIAPTSWAASNAVTTYKYDLAKAKSLLDEAGFVDTNNDGMRETPDGSPFELSLVTSEQTTIRQAIAEQFIDDMHTLGMTVTLDLLPTQELYSQQGPLFQRNFQLALFGWLRQVEPGGAVLWSCSAIPNQINNYTGDNFTGWCMDTADAAIRTATTSLDMDERKQAYATHQTLFTQELPVLPIMARQTTTIARPTIKGIRPDTFAPLTWNLSRWQR